MIHDAKVVLELEMFFGKFSPQRRRRKMSFDFDEKIWYAFTRQNISADIFYDKMTSRIFCCMRQDRKIL